MLVTVSPKNDRTERRKVTAFTQAREITAILVTELSRWGPQYGQLVWEGRCREASPYPDPWHTADYFRSAEFPSGCERIGGHAAPGIREGMTGNTPSLLAQVDEVIEQPRPSMSCQAGFSATLSFPRPSIL